MTEEEKQPATPESLSGLAITAPLNGDTISVVTDGHTNLCYATIRGTINTAWSSSVVVAFFEGDAFDPINHRPSAGVQAHLDDADKFFHNAVPFPCDADEVVAVAWQLEEYEPEKWRWVCVNQTNITVTKTNQQVVTAKSCPWFANAPTRYVGPDLAENDPREAGDIYRPIEFIPPPAPAPVTTINITNTTPAAMWRHNADAASPDNYTAAGDGGGNANVDAAYLADFGFPAMSTAPTAPLGTLVAVVIYEDSSGVEHAGSLLTVGTSSATAPINIGSGSGSKRAKRVILGFFDGYEWANNTGEMTVEVSYS